MFSLKHHLSLNNFPPLSNIKTIANIENNSPQPPINNDRTSQSPSYTNPISQPSKTTIYIENLPTNCTISLLDKALQYYEIVGTSYIAQKRTQRGLCFGFVSLQNPEDFLDAIAKICKITIGNNKLRAFPANTDTPHTETKKSFTFSQGVQSSTRSYVDIVMGKSAEDISYSSKGKNLEWLQRSARIQLKAPYFLAKLKEEVASEQIIPMGENFFLIIFQSVEQRRKFLEEEKISKSDYIHDIKAWDPSMKSNHRTVWLTIQGTPLQAWTKEFFAIIGNKFGSFICLDQITEKKERLDVARIKISTSATKINRSINVSVDNCLFEIYIKEDILEDTESRRQDEKVRNMDEEIYSAGDEGYSGNYADVIGDEQKQKQQLLLPEDVDEISVEGCNNRCKEVQNSKFELTLSPISGASVSINERLKNRDNNAITETKLLLEERATYKLNKSVKYGSPVKDETQFGKLVTRQNRRPKKSIIDSLHEDVKKYIRTLEKRAKLKQRRKSVAVVEPFITNEDSWMHNHNSFVKVGEDIDKERDVDAIKGIKKIILKKIDA